MSFAASLSAMLLAGVFVVAAIAKLLDRAGTRETLAEFGVPARAAAPAPSRCRCSSSAIAVALDPVRRPRSAGAVAGARDAPRLHRGHRRHARARRGTGLQLLRWAEPDGGRPRHAGPQRPPRRDRGVRRRGGHGRRDRVDPRRGGRRPRLDHRDRRAGGPRARAGLVLLAAAASERPAPAAPGRADLRARRPGRPTLPASRSGRSRPPSPARASTGGRSRSRRCSRRAGRSRWSSPIRTAAPATGRSSTPRASSATAS